ncbi:bifunctional monodehydroascorbate reductase and carbonic anhydrase nectarin-3 [Artemisia annua]|uniref:Bifunctional monodehydroascorbate reductase and carbonic anhydrase nectarin-3 n=1 Tax=Artemisia annua TaxID=35608 RepID=A0A2U1MRJ1_ARTAN|nr:bifunctional monodehydroascorbate reductase and carbonic anhydrase nectarin-3 [Artemisia annua]
MDNISLLFSSFFIALLITFCAPLGLSQEVVEMDRGAGHIHINGIKYQLNELHWNTPTEHTINGRRYSNGTIFESIDIYKGSQKKCWNN